MDEAAARARLERMVAHDSQPELDAIHIDDLVDQAKRQDEDGLHPDDDNWTPTWDLAAAAMEGWRRKAGLVAGLPTVDADGARVNRDGVREHCLKMADHYARKVWAAPTHDIDEVEVIANL